MGRYAPAETISGTVKSIQHISTTVSESGTNADISITAVSATNKAYIVQSSESANHYGGFEYSTEMYQVVTQQHQRHIYQVQQMSKF